MSEKIRTDGVKPCPFCGGVGELLHLKYYWGHCRECNAVTEAEISEEKALKNWNRRMEFTCGKEIVKNE